MKIRTRLTIQFTIIVVSTFFTVSVIIYIFSANYRREEFYSRLKDKAISVSKMLFEVKVADDLILKILDKSDKMLLYMEEIIIFDNNNKRIFDSRKDIKFDPGLSILNQIRKEKIIKDIDNHREYVGLCFMNEKKEYIVFASAYDIYGYRKLKNLKEILLICFVVLIFITVFLGRFFSSKALQKISNMVKQTKNLKTSNLNARLDTGKNKDELYELAKTFNTMLDELETTFNIQEDFVSNASHELRTPLTIIKSQIDVALLNVRNIDDYQRILKSISEDITNLSALTNSLLLLAQTTSKIPNYTFVKIRIDDILWQARQELLKEQSSYIVNVNFKNMALDDMDLIINANHILLKNAFLNIMENACKFSTNKTVSVHIGLFSSYIEISFSDNGVGIPKEDLKHIFKPFFRGGNVINTDGHGIGLPLVKNIISIHKGEIRINSTAGKGTTVIISLPKL